jgi:hypothetical protein
MVIRGLPIHYSLYLSCFFIKLEKNLLAAAFRRRGGSLSFRMTIWNLKRAWAMPVLIRRVRLSKSANLEGALQ